MNNKSLKSVENDNQITAPNKRIGDLRVRELEEPQVVANDDVFEYESYYVQDDENMS